jgi:hypothetical protein
MVTQDEYHTGTAWEYIYPDGRPELDIFTSHAHPWGAALRTYWSNTCWASSRPRLGSRIAFLAYSTRYETGMGEGKGPVTSWADSGKLVDVW